MDDAYSAFTGYLYDIVCVKFSAVSFTNLNDDESSIEL